MVVVPSLFDPGLPFKVSDERFPRTSRLGRSHGFEFFISLLDNAVLLEIDGPPSAPIGTN